MSIHVDIENNKKTNEYRCQANHEFEIKKTTKQTKKIEYESNRFANTIDAKQMLKNAIKTTINKKMQKQ